MKGQPVFGLPFFLHKKSFRALSFFDISMANSTHRAVIVSLDGIFLNRVQTGDVGEHFAGIRAAHRSLCATMLDHPQAVSLVYGVLPPDHHSFGERLIEYAFTPGTNESLGKKAWNAFVEAKGGFGSEGIRRECGPAKLFCESVVLSGRITTALYHSLKDELPELTGFYRQWRHHINRVVELNLGLAMSRVNKYRANDGVVEDADLFGAACEGLIRAAERYDSSRGFKFSTMAVPWINKHILLCLGHQHLIARPAHIESALRLCAEAIDSLTRQFFRHPTDSEIIEHLNEQGEKGADLLSRYRQLHGQSVGVMSFGVLDEEDDESCVDESLYCANPLPEGVDEVLNRANTDCAMASLQRSLTSEQWRAFSAYHGLNGQLPQTMDGLAESMGVNKRRLRGILKESEERSRDVLLNRVELPIR